MRKKGENSVKCAGKAAIPPDEIMISPSVAKVNNSADETVHSRRRCQVYPNFGGVLIWQMVLSKVFVCRLSPFRFAPEGRLSDPLPIVSCPSLESKIFGKRAEWKRTKRPVSDDNRTWSPLLF
jgi:hypothetical protein